MAPWRIALLVVALAAGCGGEVRPLHHDAYVWQRAWTPAVVAAVRERGRTFDAIRVLAVEIEDRASVVVGDPRAVAGMPVIAVIRVDGAHVVDADAVVDAARRTVERFPGLVGIELDHDCASSRLAKYAAVIARVRRAVPVPVSITALPSWAPSVALDDVIAAADSVTLQVHSVDHPEDGLFDAKRARAAIDAFAKRTHKPFTVALPAYGAALGVDDTGKVTGVESEEPRALGSRVHEVWAEPKDVATLLRSLEAQRPAHLVGVAWFRLPVNGDRRAWSFATLQAVRSGDVTVKLVVERHGVDVFVKNVGTVDATAPARIDLGIARDVGGVVVGDGADGYAFDASSARFTTTSPPRVRVGERVAIGWMRANEVREHVAP